MDKYQTLREKDNPANNVYPNIQAQNIPDGAVSALKIADGSITADKIASNAVTSGKLASNAVTAGKIASGAVTSAKLADQGVTTAKISDGAVTASKTDFGASDFPSSILGVTQADNFHNMNDDGVEGTIADVCEWFYNMLNNPRFVRFVAFSNDNYSRFNFFIEGVTIQSGLEALVYHFNESDATIDTDADAATFYATFKDRLFAVLL